MTMKMKKEDKGSDYLLNLNRKYRVNVTKQASNLVLIVLSPVKSPLRVGGI